MPSLSKLVSATMTHNARTANGAVTNSTSLSHLVDLFFIAGTLIWKQPSEYMQKWYAAYWENKELAFKLLFWMRDIRGWAGVRDAFNYIYNQLSPEEKKHFVKYIPEFGRWKDVFELAEQDFEPFKDIIEFYMVKWYFKSDFALFCKWFPRKGIVFNETRKMLWWSPKQLRKYIVLGSDTVETQMSNKQWSEILYEHVPSKAFAKYQKAFERHDSVRFREFVNNRPSEIKATTLFPADICKEFFKNHGPYSFYRPNSTVDKVIDAQWKNLPDYIQSDKTFLPVVDVSGSMFSSSSSRETGITPIMNSISLGLYLAERNKSIFKDCFMSFSEHPEMHYIKWDNICDKFNYIKEDPNMGYNTNLVATFEYILDSALRAHLIQSDMPDYVIVLSDMEFDSAVEWETNFETIKKEYAQYWYTMPNLIFWNLDWRIGNVPVTIDDKGTALVSWYSPAIMKSVLSSKVVTPEEIMLETLESDRYKAIKI